MWKWAALVAGSVAGGLGRYLLGEFITRRTGGVYPWGTLAVNLAGCLVIGMTSGTGTRIPEETRLLLATGFCGAFTTFSALVMETSTLGADGLLKSAFYAGGSLAAGLVLFRLGFLLTR